MKWAPLNQKRLWHTYRLGLRQHGLLTTKGHVDQQAFQRCFAWHYEKLSSLSFFQPVLNAVAIATTYSGLVRKPRRTKHPLKHLLLIDFLFGEFEIFKETYSTAEIDLPLLRVHDEGRAEIAAASAPVDYHERLYELLVDQGLSLRRVAGRLGLSTSTVAVHAERVGIVVGRRAKVLTPTTRDSILTELRLGTPFGRIRESFRVSLVTLHRLLQANLSVCTARILRKLEAKRAQFIAYRTKYPGYSRKMLERSSESGFRWLLLNDKLWLSENVPPPLKPRTSRRRVNWDTRDAVFAEQVGAAAQAAFAVVARPKRISKSTIYRQLCDLGKKSSCSDKLPLTMKTLQCAVETRDAFHDRALNWARRNPGSPHLTA